MSDSFAIAVELVFDAPIADRLLVNFVLSGARIGQTWVQSERETKSLDIPIADISLVSQINLQHLSGH